jgi:hypothetical protein
MISAGTGDGMSGVSPAPLWGDAAGIPMAANGLRKRVVVLSLRRCYDPHGASLLEKGAVWPR